MDTKTKIISIITAAALTVAGLLLLWHFTHIPQKKIVVKKHAVVKEAVKKKELPQIQKKFSNPKIAIVMDDFGYNMSYLDALFASKLPITLSILPNLPYSRRVAELAHSKGYEVILHLPLEANDKSAPAESDTIRTDMDEKRVVSMLDQEITTVPELKGVSNHQGSKATENKTTMSIILSDLKKRKLYYFDSLVTDKSVCSPVAKNLGVLYAKRDMFLDNTPTQDYIEKQVLSLRRLAFRKGSAIAICHDRKNTIYILSRMMPELAVEGIEFVSLSDMVK
jgi:polysaccharide deacetylase 2 family uncharacterized protein YibQ